MTRLCRSILAFALLLALLCPRAATYDTQEIQVDESKHDEEFFTFVTRPDIDAPRWDIKIYDAEALSDGLWFTAPYGIVRQKDHKKAYVGPHIYDGNGNLIWSGAPMFQGYDVFDFKVSRVEGRDMLTAIWPHEDVVVIVDDSYQMYKTVRISENGGKVVNMHDFQTVANGTRALFPTKIMKKASRELSQAVEYDGHCSVEFNGFEEQDLESGETLFTWSSEGRISLDESTMTGTPAEKCDGEHSREFWDYFHINSVEKLPDGDYLISGRRTYALYKISHRDGSILWRLGGKHSDFEWRGDAADAHFSGQHDAHFSGQHDARLLEQNATHMLVSIMDNASGPGEPAQTADNSRGLVLALHTHASPMTVEVVTKYPHPQGGYAPARGNFQTLDNGNAFLCWTTDALHSEHMRDGKVAMEARLLSGLKSYRAYKMPWVGRPAAPPDVVARAVRVDGDAVSTLVFVSWNGATEVAQWRLYKTGPAGLDGDEDVEEVAQEARKGFETGLLYTGFAEYVVVQALDAAGAELGASVVVRSEWLQTDDNWDLAELLGGFAAFFFGGGLFVVAAVATYWGSMPCLRRRRGTAQVYRPLATEGEETKDSFDLDGDAYDDYGVPIGRREGRYGG